MDKHKPDLKHLIRSFERLDSKWTRLNEDINRFVGDISDPSINYDDFNKFLNIVKEENDVVNNCQSLAGLLTDINKDTDRLYHDKYSDVESNANARVHYDDTCCRNVEGCDKETPVVISGQFNNSVEAVGYDPNFDNIKDTSEKFKTNIDCSTLSKDSNDLPKNLILEREHSKELIHDAIVNTANLIDENVNKPKIAITDEGAKTDPFKSINKSTEMFVPYQNENRNLFSYRDEGNNYSDPISLLNNEEMNNYPDNSNFFDKNNNGGSIVTVSDAERNKCLDNFKSVDEDDNGGSISLLDNTKRNNCSDNFNSTDKDENGSSILLLDNALRNKCLDNFNSVDENDNGNPISLLTNTEANNYYKTSESFGEDDKAGSAPVLDKVEGNNYLENSPFVVRQNSVDEDDSGDSISLLDDEEKNAINDMLYSNDKLHLSKENKESKLNDNNLKNKNIETGIETQNTDFQYSSIETMGNICDKNEVKVIETTNKGQHGKITYYSVTNSASQSFENDIEQKTSSSEINFYDDILTWDDKNSIYAQRNSENECDEFDSFNGAQDNYYEQVSRVDGITAGRKKKNMLLFKNICYFHLINKCNRVSCTFPHVIPDDETIKLELKNFNNNLLIEEYDLIKDNKIKFDYGLCFLEECLKRNLTKEVIRMAIDFIKITKSSEEDAYFQSIVTKTTLLYINNANIDEYKYLLTATKLPRNRCLRDVLLETISVTEQFSDYKLAFIKLTYITPTAFSYTIASSILKQICDIAVTNEAPLFWALLNVIKNTHPRIFQDPLIQRFENMIKHDIELITEFIHLKSVVFGLKIEVNNRVDRNTSVTDQPQNLTTTSSNNNTSNSKNTFHPAILSLNVIRKHKSNKKNIVKPKEAESRNSLVVTRDDPIYSERVLPPNISRRQSSNNKNVVKPRAAEPHTSMPVTREDSINSESIASPNTNRRHSSDDKNVVKPRKAELRNSLIENIKDSIDSERLASPTISRRHSSDNRNVVKSREAEPNNSMPVTREGSINSERISSPNINRRHSSDNKNVVNSREAEPRNSLPETRKDSIHSARVSSPTGINVEKVKKTLTRKPLVVTRQHDPNYVQKNLKRRKCSIKIRQWENLTARSQDCSKENKKE